MGRALVIDSSSRHVGSITRALTKQFISSFVENNGESNLVYRDLAKSSVPHLSAEAIEGFFSPTPSLRAKRATVLSDLLLEEFLGADLICIGVPMYNFNLPSALKAYLDQIVRIGKTFQKQGDGRLKGLCNGKNILVLYSMGGMYKDSDMDFIKPYFKAITKFIGADRVDFVAIQGTSRAGFNLQEQLSESGEVIQNYLAKRGKKENTLLSMLSE